MTVEVEIVLGASETIIDKGKNSTVVQNENGPKVRKGDARVKKEYLRTLPLTNKVTSFIENSSNPDNEKKHVDQNNNNHDNNNNDNKEVDEPQSKKKKLKGGQNKKRDKSHSHDSIRLCNFIALGEECPRGESCKQTHDVKAYLAVKEPDLGQKCHIYETFGYCKYGLRCRFASSHITEDLKNISPKDDMVVKETVTNIMGRDAQKEIRSKHTPTPRTDEFFAALNSLRAIEKKPLKGVTSIPQDEKETFEVVGESITTTTVQEEDDLENVPKPAEMTEETNTEELVAVKSLEHENKLEKALESSIEPVFKLPTREKKKLDFRGKSYLAPLTTVGNLPFRRICKDFGVDITCGEMAVASNLLSGQQHEWALMRRHASEDIFGVQVAGCSPFLMSKAAEMINNHCDVDFVDINCGCPIDSIYKSGAGSALIDRGNRLGEMYRAMDYALDCPVTIKIRTGVVDFKPTLHKLIPKFKEWKVPLLTLHGRTRQQRYTRLSDWEYIDQCAKLAGDDMLFFGNGDVLSHVEYYQHLDNSSVSGIMMGRGALIKPWIFTEIKERRIWDIRSSERLDMLKKFANYGLEHWGSDTMGVNQTRRFLCEWLSFLYRYIPVGLLEVVPQKMNERPPPFYGRDDLETLMGSSSAEDWVKITELILGTAPSDFKFVPKHKSNSYSNAEDALNGN